MLENYNIGKQKKTFISVKKDNYGYFLFKYAAYLESHSIIYF